MINKLSNSDKRFICEMGEFISNHFIQIVELLGKDRVEQLANIWNETKTN